MTYIARIGQVKMRLVTILLVVGFALPTGAYAATILQVSGGGTGWGLPGGMASGTIPYGKGLGRLGTTTSGSNGQVLSLVGGTPTWASGSGVGTSTEPFMAKYYVATSTLIASTFPYASSTAITATTGFIGTSLLPLVNGTPSLGSQFNGFSALWLKDSGSVYDVGLQITNTGAAASHNLTFDVGNYDPTLTFSGGAGNPTLGDWFNQSVKTTAYPSFAGASTTLLTAPTIWTGLGTAAGSFLAVDPSGQVIATTTPTGGGVTTLSAIGSSANANGATITGTTLNLEPASASFGGVVTTGTQTLAGVKTFNADLLTNGSLTASDNLVATNGYSSVDDYITIGGNTSLQVTANLRGSANPVTYLYINKLGSTVINTQSAASVLVDGAFTESSGTNHPLIAGIAVLPTTITSAAGTVSDTASLYIKGAATTTTVSGNNYSLWVDDVGGGGKSLLDGQTTITNATTTLHTSTTSWIDTLNLTNDLTVANGGTGASTLTGCLTGNGTGAITGSGTCNTSNATVSSIATTYPVTGGTITTTGTIALAFGTTTSNTWAGTQTFGTIANTGGYTQSGTTANTFTGTPTFSNATYSALFTGGNVGIGTTEPAVELDVVGDLRIQGNDGWNGDGDLAIMRFGNQLDDNGVFGAYGTRAMGFSVYKSGANGPLGADSYEAMSILSTSGNVGIGTTTPYAKLSIGGDVVVGAATAGGTLGDLYLPKLGTAAGTFLAVDNVGKVIATTTPSGGSPGGSNGQIQFNDSSSFGGFVSSFIDKLKGTFGLGTTTPRWLLQLATSTAPQLTLTDNTPGNETHWSFWNKGGNLFFSTSSPTTFATSTKSIQFPNNGGCIGCTDIMLSTGINLRNAKYLSATSTSIVANTSQTIYTAPAGRRAFIYLVFYSNSTAGSIIYNMTATLSGSTYQITASTTVGTQSQATFASGNGIVLEPGDSIGVLSNTSSGSSRVTVDAIEYDSSVPYYSAKSFSPSSGTSTLYTVPSDKSAILPGFTTTLTNSHTFGGVSNATASTITGKFFQVKNGSVADDAMNVIRFSGTLANANTVNISTIPTGGGVLSLNSGDSIQFYINNPVSLIWLNVVEI